MIGYDKGERSDLPDVLRFGVEDYQAEMEGLLFDIEKRNEALLVKSMQTQPSKGCLRSMVADVQVRSLKCECQVANL